MSHISEVYFSLKSKKTDSILILSFKYKKIVWNRDEFFIIIILFSFSYTHLLRNE